jgi:hypothetical protein
MFSQEQEQSGQRERQNPRYCDRVSLWATAAIGLTVGIGDYLLVATVTTLGPMISISNYFFTNIGFERHQTESKSEH